MMSDREVKTIAILNWYHDEMKTTANAHETGFIDTPGMVDRIDWLQLEACRRLREIK